MVKLIIPCLYFFAINCFDTDNLIFDQIYSEIISLRTKI